MQPSGSLSDIAGSVQHYLAKKQEQVSLASELWQYAQWVPLAYAARAAGYSRLAFLFGTWFVLGATIVLYMRQRVVNVSWWQALAAAVALAAFFRGELALPANAFFSFFAQYLIGATAATAIIARLLPAHLTSELPAVLHRIGILQRPVPTRRSEKAE